MIKEWCHLCHMPFTREPFACDKYSMVWESRRENFTTKIIVFSFHDFFEWIDIQWQYEHWRLHCKEIIGSLSPSSINYWALTYWYAIEDMSIILYPLLCKASNIFELAKQWYSLWKTTCISLERLEVIVRFL